MSIIAPTIPEFLYPSVANALNPVCYFLFYWFGIIISPEALVCFLWLAAMLVLLLVSAVPLSSDDA